MALTAADQAPWVVIDHGDVLGPARCEWIIEVVLEASWLVPCILGVSKEHSEQVAGAGFAVCAAIRAPSMHHAKVVEELNITLLAVKLHAEALSELLDSVHGVHLSGVDLWHAGVSVNQGSAE